MAALQVPPIPATPTATPVRPISREKKDGVLEDDIFIPRSSVGESPLVIPPVMNSDNPKWDNVVGFMAARVGFINNYQRVLTPDMSTENLEELEPHLKSENSMIPTFSILAGGNASERVSLYMSYLQYSYGTSAHNFTADYKEVDLGLAVGIPLGDSYIAYTWARPSLEFDSSLPTTWGANCGVVLDSSHYITARTRLTPWLSLGTSYKAPKSDTPKGELMGSAEIGYFPIMEGIPVGLGVSVARNKVGADLDIYRAFNLGVQTDGRTTDIKMSLSLGVGLRKS